MPIRPENKVRYPKDWKLRSRFIRFYRAKNCCEWCGIANGTSLPAKCCKEPIFDERRRCLSCGKPEPRVVLTTAHVHDHNPEACGFLNLAALCQRCHNKHDAKDRARRRKERLDQELGQMDLFKD